jgi:hypothetical protein
MEWVLIISILWTTPETSNATQEKIEGFQSEATCRAALKAVSDELKVSFEPNSQVNTHGRVVCVQKK